MAVNTDALARHMEDCGPDASLSGVDQSWGPDKVWCCDSCGAEGTSDELQGRARR